MRPKTNAEFAAALKLQSHYATDSEGRWLLEECAKIIASIDGAPQPAPVAAAPAERAPEQNAPAAVEDAEPPKPQRLPRKAKVAE